MVLPPPPPQYHHSLDQQMQKDFIFIMGAGVKRTDDVGIKELFWSTELFLLLMLQVLFIYYTE